MRLSFNKELLNGGDQVLLGEARVATGENADDRLVLGNGARPVVLIGAEQLETRDIESKQRDKKCAHLPGKKAVAGAIAEGEVELEVMLVESAEIFELRGVAHAIERLPHRGEVGGPFDGETGGETFESGAELVDLIDVSRGEAGDASRMTGGFLNEAFVHQGIDGFANASLGDAEDTSPVAFDDAITGGEAACDDFGTQTTGHGILAETWSHRFVSTQKTSAQVG